jgi:ribosomal protein L37E
MLIEVTIADEQDIDHAAHLLTCNTHRREFVDKILEMLTVSLDSTPPTTIVVLSMEITPEGYTLTGGELRPGATYHITDDATAILCLRCGRTSYHPDDVANLYCGNCHMFHERVRGGS